MERIGVIGVPFNTGSKGASIEKGAEALRKAGIVSVLRGMGDVADFGDLEVVLPEADLRNPRLLKPDQVEALSRALAKKVKDIVTAGYSPFIVGGDCSALTGVVEGLRSLNGRIGLVYMDAHGDFNTPETTPSGVIGGMGLAIVTGRGPEMLTAMFGHVPLIPGENVVLYGARDLDVLEEGALAESNVRVYKRVAIRLRGGEEPAQEVADYLKLRCDFIYLHVDLDVLDGSVFSAVGLPVPDGLLKEEFRSIVKALVRSGKLCGVGLMSLDPAKDSEGSEASTLVGLVAEAFAE
jgi:arginase